MVGVVLSPAAEAGELDGEYSVGPQSVDVKIKSWGEDCGPKPKSYSTKGKGTVTVTESGDHLIFSNGRSTKKCWSANPKLQRLSVTKKGSSWTIVCESPATDSRYEYGTYVVTAGGGKISVEDTSKYDWKLKESICSATIVIKRSFTKLDGTAEDLSGEQPGEDEPVEDGKPATKVPDIEKAYPEAPPPSKCKQPGPPVKLVLLPASVKTNPGRKVCFTTYEVDKNGCRTAVEGELKLVKEAADRSGRLDGNCFVPGDSAADSEGSFKVVATYGYDTATARIVVLTDFIEDLVAVNLDPVGAGEAQGGGAGSDTDIPVSSEQIDLPVPGRRKPPLFLLYVLPPGLLAILLVVIVVVAARERKKKLRMRIADLEQERMRDSFQPPQSASPLDPADDPSHPARQRRQAHIPQSGPHPRVDPAAHPGAPVSTQRMICRVCGREYPSGSRFCPHDGSTLVPEREQEAGLHESGMICPRCGRGYPPRTRNCGEDGELLVPAPVAATGLDRTGTNPPRGQKKICPVCSLVYGDESTFCGKDGARLMPMN